MEFSNDDARALLARIAQREEAAMRELHHLFGRRVYAFALNRLHDPTESEEVVSDTLFEVWRHPERFRGESQFSTWLLGIARHKLLDRLRARRTDEEDIDEVIDTLQDDGPGALEVIAGAERRAGVKRCMEGLSDTHRECLNLVFYEELSLAEVASLQGCPENTVKTRLFHARQNIRRCLEKLLRAEGH